MTSWFGFANSRLLPFLLSKLLDLLGLHPFLWANEEEAAMLWETIY